MGLVEQQAAAARAARSAPIAPGRELAVLVAVEFTGERRRLTASARLARADAARTAAARTAERAHPSPPAGQPDEAQDVQPDNAQPPPDLDFDASLAEFQELARSAGAEIADTLVQRRARPDPATLVGQGKLAEIEAVAASTRANVVLFDHDLSPSQLRNLEATLPCRVIDRTQLILDIFARHARTREGQLQVELAQLEYQLPRLAGRGKAMSQLGGGIGTRGPGETQLETDRRKINLRIDHVKQQLDSVRRIRRQQRQRREAIPVPVVALVGYTNAGKSTLFNALTLHGQSGPAALESSRMFATLDPKLKQLQLPSRRRVLLSDTVGFIRSLPHTLVTSFRATLEEVERAEVLLHVRDASSPIADEQKAQVEKVLAEIDVQGKPVIEVLNKIDLLPQYPPNPDLLSAEARARLLYSADAPAAANPVRVAISALAKTGLDDLLAAIDEALVADPLVEARLRLPQSEGAALAALEAGAVVREKTFEGNLVHLTARGPASLLARYRRFRQA